jgi:hypothetical protein
MKRYLLLLTFVISVLSANSQICLDFDVVKLDTLLAQQKTTQFKYDTVSVYHGGILGSYKDSVGNELVINFDSLNSFQKVLDKNENKTILYNKDKTRLIYFENDYISVLYVELPAYNVTLSFTTYVTSKEFLEKIYKEINPEKLLKEVSFAHSRVYMNFNMLKLNYVLARQKVTGLKFDSVSVYYGILGTYKDSAGGELVINFDSLSKFQEVLNANEHITILFNNGKTRLIYFENDYISVLYVELPAFNVTLALTTYTTSKEFLEKIYKEINPEEILKPAAVK